MSASRTLVFITAASAVVLSLSAPPVLAQGRSGGHANGPKVTTPVQSGKPATPPGQAKTPPPTANPQGAAGPKVKTTGPIVVKPSLASNLQPLLPAGMTMDAASLGFKNLGQFVAAVHVSHNLDIPFSSLKTEMVTNNHSLGQSIQVLKPAADANVEVTRAEKAAKADIDKFGK
jgi:hypothetical protein